MKVDFYQLADTPLERVLPVIAQKLLSSGERLLVVDNDAERRALLDRALWTFSTDSFLPHGQAGDGTDSLQQVLIAPEVIIANDARNIAITDGIWRDAALDFDRAFHFFDDTTVPAAREAWRSLNTREGIERRYWRQDENGRWQQAA